MKKLLPDIINALGRGERVILTTVLESLGSTPRKTGSAMAVFADGSSKGTVGGGAIEYEVQRVAREEMLPADSEPAKTLGYSLTSDGTGDLCMICGGDVTVHFCALSPSAELLKALKSAADSPDGEACIELRIVKGAPTEITFLPPDAQGDAGKSAKRGKAYFEKENDDYDGRLTLPIGDLGRVYIFGGGHVGRELSAALARVAFNCVVFDDREDYALAEHFPEAERVVLGDFKRIDDSVTLTGLDYVIVVTRGHKNDYEVLAQTLPSPARYVGCMGSRRKMAVIRERLRDEAGLSAEAISRLVSPVGLQIGAETPEELAVSIAAELIQFRAGA
ncbi:MAG: XdhC/CoxI family protein [Oscillospiraceae bacterium]|jgi:xanthine dehydrogenase accessory factor|nr:XdhC/CoxI family protein [Oscillospiraceae bacterium]